MTSVTIFGSGNMGTAIDGVLTAGGADVEHIGSADTSGTVAGDVTTLEDFSVLEKLRAEEE